MDDTSYRKFAERCKMNQYAVRIETKTDVGTGFLYTVKDSEYIYIATVCHIILRSFVKDEIIEIKYLDNSQKYSFSQFELCTLYEKDELTEELCGELEDEEFKERYKDIAVLRIRKTDFANGSLEIPNYICRLPDEKIKRDIRFVGYGFPDGNRFYEELFGICLGWEDKMITCKAQNINSQPFEAAMKGFSGTGLIAEYEDGPVLLGVVAACDSNELHQQFRIVGSTEISERLKKIGWETLEEYDGGMLPAGFYRGDMMNFQDEYLKDLDRPTKELLCGEFRKIDQECFPQRMLTDEKFYNIPICDGNRKKCKYYWCGRAWTILIAQILHGDVHTNLYSREDGTKLSIEYICSEGNGKADLASVVGAAANYLILGKEISGDSILVWQSRGNPGTKRTFSKGKFKRIIKDIAEGDSNKYKEFSRDAAYDLLYGEMKEKDYGIIHIQCLADKLDGCRTNDDLKKKMEEILDEIWG